MLDSLVPIHANTPTLLVGELGCPGLPPSKIACLEMIIGEPQPRHIADIAALNCQAASGNFASTFLTPQKFFCHLSDARKLREALRKNITGWYVCIYRERCILYVYIYICVHLCRFITYSCPKKHKVQLISKLIIAIWIYDNIVLFHKDVHTVCSMGTRKLTRWRISGDSWMYPYQRTPMGNPHISPI